MISDRWDRYAQARSPRRLVNAAGASTWFNWTQYPDHGPGLEVLDLDDGSRVLDLGCGKGGNLAHVCASGYHGIGVDVSAPQLAHARTRWPGLPVHHRDAVSYLLDGEESFDAVYSVFGALWFVDPEVLLPAIHHRLRGVLAFSWSPMKPIPGLPRWDLDPGEWRERLEKHGYEDIECQVIDPPAGAESDQCTFFVRATRAGGRMPRSTREHAR